MQIRLWAMRTLSLLAAILLFQGCGDDPINDPVDLVPDPGPGDGDRNPPDRDDERPIETPDDETPDDEDRDDEEEPINPPTRFGSLRVGLLPDTQAGGENVAIHPMKAILEKFEELEVDVVIPVGDLTDYGSTGEFTGWTDLARTFRDRGMEFLPLMGNHEDSWAYTVEWVDFMSEFIPQDAYHLRGAEYLDYYVIRENVLFILLRYYHLPVAFPWIRQVVENHRDQVDHIVIASHDGLVGAKYGETREMIVEGVKDDDRLFAQWDEIRAFFAQHDVLWVQGHEHMYQRSVIRAPIGHDLSTWTVEAGGRLRGPRHGLRREERAVVGRPPVGCGGRTGPQVGRWCHPIT